MRIDLKKVSVSGFVDIGDNQSVVLDKNRLYGVFGVNKDTGGSNAAGKTSFIKSIAAGIYGLSAIDLTSKEVRNRHLDQAPRIQVALDVNGDTLEIDRTIGGALSYRINENEWISGKSEDVQAQINAKMGLTQDQFLMLSCRMQGDHNGFLLMKDSEKKEFLSSFLDLTGLEAAEDRLKEEIRQKEIELARLEGSIPALTEMKAKNTSQSEEIRLKLESAVLDFNQKTAKFNETKSLLENSILALKDSKTRIGAAPELIILNNSILGLQEELEAFVKKSENEVKDLLQNKARLESLIHEPAAIPEELLNEKQSLQARIKDLANTEMTLQRQMHVKESLIKDLRSIESDSEKVKDSVCGHCKQSLPEQSKQQRLSELNAKIDSISSKLSAIDLDMASSNDAINTLKAIGLESRLNAINEKIAQHAADNSKESLKKELDSVNAILSDKKSTATALQQKIKSLKLEASSKENSILSRIDSEITALEGTIKQGQSDLRLLSQGIMALESTHQTLLQGAAEVEKKIESQARLKEEISHDMEILEASRSVISKNGFIGHLFDSILNDLTNETNKNLQMMSLMRSYYVFFNSDKIAKTNKSVTKSITAEIYCEGSPVTFAGLSGAEKESLMLAVDEALDCVMSNRLGVHLGWKILDEQFMWVDEQNKEHVFNFLNQKSQTKTYLVVDHASEFNASLENRIVVTKQNKIARISQ